MYYALFLYLLFLYFTEYFLNQQSNGPHSKHLYTKVLLISVMPIDNLLWRAKIGVFQSAKFCINEWSKLDNMIKKSVNIKRFKFMLMKFLPLQKRSLFSIHDLTGVKLLTRVRVNELNELNELNFI